MMVPATKNNKLLRDTLLPVPPHNKIYLDPRIGDTPNFPFSLKFLQNCQVGLH